MRQIRSFITGVYSPNSPPPYLLKLRSHRWFIIATICFAVFTDIFLYGIIVPVIPFALSQRLSVEESSAQSYVSILLATYGIGLLVASPFTGWYADEMSSRRWPLLAGLVALAVSTGLLCTARTVAQFIAGRVIQGIAAAVVWTVGAALLVDTVGEDNVAQALGYVVISMNVGYLLAPLLGGVVYNQGGYYAVFGMAFGLIGLDIILRLFLIEQKIAKQWDVGEVRDLERNSGGERRSEGLSRVGEATATLDSPAPVQMTTFNSKDNSAFVYIPRKTFSQSANI
jgi:MFS family permease